MPESHDPTFENDDILAASLGRLPREKMPPAALEEATVETLRGAGLIHIRRRRALTMASWVLAASIGAVAFVGGSMFATRGGTPFAARGDAGGAGGAALVSDAEPRYALLLYGGNSNDDSATLVRRATEYAEWAGATHASARIVGGEALGGPTAAVAMVQTASRGTDSVIVEEEPIDPNGLVGYFLVAAPNREAVLRLARDCPHVKKYGGRVVIRRVWADGR